MGWPGRRVGCAVAAAVALLGTSCGNGVEPAATVLVDYDHDEFATQFLRYFPEEVAVHPGDTVRFQQYWTGEPHTVTLGSAVGPVLEVTRPLLAEYGDLPIEEVPEDVLGAYIEAESTLPAMYPMDVEESRGAPGESEAPATEAGPSEADEESDALSQTAAQPCVIPTGGAMPEGGAPCEGRELAPFTGTEVLYNSGVIPYDGPSGNVFDLTLSEDIAPGSYPFVCLVHGSFQSGVLTVLPEDEPTPGPRAVTAAARRALDDGVAPLADAFSRVVAEGRYERGDQVFEGRFAGLLQGEMDGVVNEFIPAEFDVSVDEPVTWRFFGPHSVSFDVPEYFPIVEFLDDGTVSYNEEIDRHAGGAPDPGDPPEEPGEPWVLDGGSYDGSGYWSSGVLYSDAWVEYTLRFSEPGEYPFACLIHPPMVGVVRVRE